MKQLNKTAVELINELELDSAEFYTDCKVFELEARNQNESTMYLLVDGNTVENVICEKTWWNYEMATDEFLTYLEDVYSNNNLMTGF